METKKRGVIFSTDAILAVVISALLLFFTFNVVDSAQRTALDEVLLSRTSADMLRCMEKAGLFYNATTKDAEVAKNEITNFTGVLPYNLCIYSLQFKDYPSGNVTARFARIRGCQCTARIATSKRDYVYYVASTRSFKKYVAQLDTCYAERS